MTSISRVTIPEISLKPWANSSSNNWIPRLWRGSINRMQNAHPSRARTPGGCAVHDLTLISFDGIPGSGKSSTALWLGELLEKKGVSVRVVAEHETPHPVRFLTDLKKPLRPWVETRPHDFSEACLGKFSRFLEGIAAGSRSPTVIIVDGLLFHTDSTSLLLMDPDKGFFDRHVAAMHHIALQRIRFLPVLLYNQPYAGGLPRTMEQRPEAWSRLQIHWKLGSPFCKARKLRGSRGYIQFYAHYEKRIYDLFKALPLAADAHLVLENPAMDWSASREKIWSFCSRHVLHTQFFNNLL